MTTAPPPTTPEPPTDAPTTAPTPSAHATTKRPRAKPRPVRRAAAEYVAIDIAAQRLDVDPDALRARCRRAAVRVGTIVQADLGAGVIAVKLGRSWRVRFPSAA